MFFGELYDGTPGNGTGVDIDSTVAIPTLPADAGVTLAAWVKRSATNGDAGAFAYVIGLGASGDNPVMTLGIDDSNGLVTGFIEGDGGEDQVSVIGDTPVVNDVWTHIAVSFDRVNDEALTYVNGVAQALATDISAVGDGSLDWANATIGRFVAGTDTTTRHFPGLIDDVYYYDEVLTPSEIQELAVPPGGLVGHWEFETAPGGITPDSTGNGHSGTLEGGASIIADVDRGNVLSVSGLATAADGVNIHTTVPIPDLPANAGVTLAAWIKRNADASAGDERSYIIGMGDFGDFPIVSLAVDANDFVSSFIEGSGGADQVSVIGDTEVVNGVWTHIAVTFDRVNNEASTYVNGVAQASPTDISLVGDGPLSWNYATIGRTVKIGTGLVDVRYFGGLIDDARCYDKVLTSAEIQALAAMSGNTFATWIAGFSGLEGQTGLDDDPDGDGIDNGVENLFGTDPGQFSQGLIAGTVDTGANTFTFTHPVNDNPASDLSQTYRWSKDLSVFTPASGTHEGTTVTITPGTPSGGFVTVIAEISGTATSKLFVDVLVTQP